MLKLVNVDVSARLARSQTLELPHDDRYRNATLALLGIDTSGRLAAEVFYRASDGAGDPSDEWIAHFLFDADGTQLECRDEDYGRNTTFEPLPLDGFSPPPPVTRELADVFDYAGARWRGLCETDRVPDVLQPLSVAEKLALAAQGLPGPVLGIAESRITAAAPVGNAESNRSKFTFICRRLRIAYSVPLKRDAEGLPYDYDTYVLYLAHLIDSAGVLPSPPTLSEALASGVVGARPMDALYDAHSGRLYVADGGDATHPAAIHLFRLA